MLRIAVLVIFLTGCSWAYVYTPSLEDAIRDVREKVWGQLREMREKFKVQARERENLMQRIDIVCDPVEFFKKLKSRMNNLEQEFANLTVQLDSIPRVMTKDLPKVADGNTPAQGAKDYKEALDAVRLLHSRFDSIEGDVWLGKFQRQILNRKVRRLTRKMTGPDVTILKEKLSVWGLDGNAEYIIAEKRSSAENKLKKPIYLPVTEYDKKSQADKKAYAFIIRNFSSCLPKEVPRDVYVDPWSLLCKRHFLDFAALDEKTFVAIVDTENAILHYDVTGHEIDYLALPRGIGGIESVATLDRLHVVIGMPIKREIGIVQVSPLELIKVIKLEYTCGWDIVVTSDAFVLGCEFPSMIRIFSRDWELLHSISNKTIIERNPEVMKQTVQEESFTSEFNETEIFYNDTWFFNETSSTNEPLWFNITSTVQTQNMMNESVSEEKGNNKTTVMKLFSRPHWLSFDAKTQTLLYTDARTSVFGGLFLNGTVKFLRKRTMSDLWWPHDLVIRENGDVYVTDVSNDQIAVFTLDGTLKGHIREIYAPSAVTILPKTSLLVVGSQDGSISVLRLRR